MSDDEDYNSEEDLDYVPTDGEQVSEEEHSGDEEDLGLLQDEETEGKATSSRRGKPTAKKKSSLPPAARQRKGGIKLDGGDAGSEDPEAVKEIEQKEQEEKERKEELAQQLTHEDKERKEEKEKKRADDLWASFMTDVKPTKSRPTTPAAASSTSAPTAGGLGSLSSAPVKPVAVSKKVTITKVFDFAGEEVKVTKEVDANSKEAKEQISKLGNAQKVPETSPSTSSPTPQSSLKRPSSSGGLGSVLNKIGKKSKMGTLEKSKLDWNQFKSKEGIQDDLAIHNKGKQGYTERMAFLNRTDVRQFEIEKSLRLGTSKR